MPEFMIWYDNSTCFFMVQHKQSKSPEYEVIYMCNITLRVLLFLRNLNVLEVAFNSIVCDFALVVYLGQRTRDT